MAEFKAKTGDDCVSGASKQAWARLGGLGRTGTVQALCRCGSCRQPVAGCPPTVAEGRLVEDIRRSVEAASAYLLSLQTPQGYWCGEVEGDATLEADYILLHRWLGRTPPDEACDAILERQSESGGWNLYRSGPDNVSASVKAYVAARLSGLAATDTRMRLAASRIRRLGYANAANSYTRFYLSLLGLYPRSGAPSIPPEWFMVRPRSRFSVYGMASWSRAILAPLSILDATGACRPVPEGIGEIVDATRLRFNPLKAVPRFLRDAGIKAARNWILGHLQHSDGLGAIYPAIVNSIMALDQLGLSELVELELGNLEGLVLHGDAFRVQPCRSPIWDTALAMCALGGGPRCSRAEDWLLSSQVHFRGDWALRNPEAPPGGWAFEFQNEHYPDMDDTAQVLLALSLGRIRNRRGLHWLASMQSPDGGWAAFDIGDGPDFLDRLPFADHIAMRDRTCPDITGRCLEALCKAAPGWYPTHVRRAESYLRRTQETDGSWYGRWGVNYLYGTCFALRGLREAGLARTDPAVLNARAWVLSKQNADGGWGETPESYVRPELRGSGRSTPSQTAWALMALIVAGGRGDDATKRGLRFLLDRQTPEGTWEETASTGCGFPGVFYLRYSLYPLYFPLMALREYLR